MQEDRRIEDTYEVQHFIQLLLRVPRIKYNRSELTRHTKSKRDKLLTKSGSLRSNYGSLYVSHRIAEQLSQKKER